MECRVWNPQGQSQADAVKALPLEVRQRAMEGMTPRKALALIENWDFWARPKQKPPPLIDVASPNRPAWRYWLIYAGRMFGKSRTAAEWVRARVERGEVRQGVLAGPRYEDVERVQIANLQAVFPAARRPKYFRDQHRLLFWPWTVHAPYMDICSGEIPDSFRGPEWDFGWLDEFAAFRRLDDVWMRLIPAMRAVPLDGSPPQLCCTTTPRNRKVLHDLLNDPTAVLTQGSSDENSHNVASGVIEAVRFIYGNSEFADQELGGQLLGNEPGAMFRAEHFSANRCAQAPRLKKKYVIVDTSGSSKDNANECGIILIGLSEDGQTAYVLGDYSLRAPPDEWAKRAFEVYRDHKADGIIYEKHYGGELVPTIFKLLKLDAKFIPIPAVGTKPERAQPVRALVQSGRVKFVGVFPALELQCTTWTPADPPTRSPDRMDALVHGVTFLFPVIKVARGTVPGLLY